MSDPWLSILLVGVLLIVLPLCLVATAWLIVLYERVMWPILEKLLPGGDPE